MIIVAVNNYVEDSRVKIGMVNQKNISVLDFDELDFISIIKIECL